MDISVYKTIHILGLVLVVMSLGGIIMHSINGGTKGSNSFRKVAMATHGVGLLLLLVAGFGMLAKLQIHGFPVWIIIKLGVWLALGGVVGAAYKNPALAKKLWIVVPTLVLLAVIAGLYHIGA